VADDVAVMCKGGIVETGNAKDILKNPKHNYTQQLVDAAQLSICL